MEPLLTPALLCLVSETLRPILPASFKKMGSCSAVKYVCFKMSAVNIFPNIKAHQWTFAVIYTP